MNYEDGMKIIWDVITREVTVIFRGEVTPLPGKFVSRQAGIEAGEELCRNAGWGAVEPGTGSEVRRSEINAPIGMQRN